MLPAVFLGLQPELDAPPVEPDPQDGEYPGWHSWGGTHTWDEGTGRIVVTADGTQASWTINSDAGTVPNSIVGRRYTGSARVRGLPGGDDLILPDDIIEPDDVIYPTGGATTIGRTLRLVWRERLAAGGTPLQGEASITLTGSFQPITASYTAVGLDSEIDLRLSCNLAGAGDRFEVE